MVAVKKHQGKRSIPLADAIPELLASALENEDDLIITCEKDPETGGKMLHIMTGKLVSTCMLSKLKTLIETFPEDGGTIRSGKWK